MANINDDIQKLAVAYGKIQESRILVDPRSNMSRGVAFIHYEKHEEAEAAIKALNDLKLPGHNTALAARYARRNRAGRRPRRRSRSRSPRRRRGGRSPRRRRPLGGRRRGYYEDEFEDDYDAYYPRRGGYAPYGDDAYDLGGSERGYSPYGRMQPGGGRQDSGYTTYTPPTVTNTAGTGNGGYGAQISNYGYGSQLQQQQPQQQQQQQPQQQQPQQQQQQQQGTQTGRVDGYRSYPQTGQFNGLGSSEGYGASARY